jgi:hypothetical protein
MEGDRARLVINLEALRGRREGGSSRGLSGSRLVTPKAAASAARDAGVT